MTYGGHALAYAILPAEYSTKFSSCSGTFRFKRPNDTSDASRGCVAPSTTSSELSLSAARNRSGNQQRGAVGVESIAPSRLIGRNRPDADIEMTRARGTSTGQRLVVGPTTGDSLQNHPEWHADDAIQLLLPKRLHGRPSTRRWARPARRWGLLRDNSIWRGQQFRGGLPNHPEWHADDAIQLLLPRQLSKLPGRRTAVCGTPPSRRRGPLRDNAVWWGQQLRWDGLQDHFEWHADDAIHLLLPKRGA